MVDEDRVARIEAHLDRLTVIVTSLAKTVNQHDAMMTRMAEMLAAHDARMAVLEAAVVRLDGSIARLDRLIEEVFHQRHDGREG
jgi:hypothetical protein